jgi:hypothetical protein
MSSPLYNLTVKTLKNSDWDLSNLKGKVRGHFDRDMFSVIINMIQTGCSFCQCRFQMRFHSPIHWFGRTL